MLMDECQHYVKEICAHIPVRYSPGAASCRRESGPGSAWCREVEAKTSYQTNTRIGRGIMPPRIGSRLSLVPPGSAC